MEVSFNRNNYLFYDLESAKKDAVEIFKGSQWDTDDIEEEQKESSRTLYHEMTIPQGQGSLSLRKKVVKKFGSFFCLSLEALRASKEHNPQLVTILQCKRIAHTFNFKGHVETPEGNKIDLEAFNETFIIPMVGASLLKWASTKNLEEQEKALAINSILANTLFYDCLDDTRVERALENLAKGVPVLVGSGWDWHSTQVILFKDKNKDHYYLINCNRGSDCRSAGGTGSGWKVYKIGKIDALLIKNLANRLNYQKSDYLSCEKLVNEYGAKLIYQRHMKEQSVGNCTYTSLKAAINALMKIYEKNRGFKERISEELFLNIERMEENSSYKMFSWADKQFVLEDFLIELKENKEAKHILSFAEMIYRKLTSSPLMGFKMGWKLWIETIELCQKLVPSLPTFNPHIIPLIKEFIAESSNNYLSSDHLDRLISHLANKCVSSDTEIANCINCFKSLICQEKGFDEAKKVVLKLLDRGYIAPGIDLLATLIKKNQSCKEESIFCKNTLKNSFENVNKGFWVIAGKLQLLTEALIAFGKIEIVLEWMEDPKIKENLGMILQFIFKTLYVKDDRESIQKLVPFLSEKSLDSPEMRAFCIDLIEANQMEEVLKIMQKMNSTTKERLFQKIAMRHIEKKLWKEAFTTIQRIENFISKKEPLLALCKALIKEHLWDEAREIILEIKKLGDPIEHADALSELVIEQIKMKMWESVKGIIEELKSQSYILPSILSKYSQALSKEGKFEEALEVAKSIKNDDDEKVLALMELSACLQKAGEIQKAEGIQALCCEIKLALI